MARPLIAISMSSTSRTPPRALLNDAYVEAVQAAGGVPVLLPPSLEAAARDQLLALAGGLLLTGGADIDPALYGEARHGSVTVVERGRDDFELALFERARALGLPLFAICRGMQLVNVALGGSLVQDIPSCVEGAVQHAQGNDDRGDACHVVRLEPASLLAGLAGASTVATNSLHHQALARLGEGLVVTAQAPDGVIEGVDFPGYGAWFAGVQWHPEERWRESALDAALFRAFIAAATR